MKALRTHATGGPETLTLDEVETPTPGKGEVLVDVKACAINYPDTLMIRDLYQFKPERPYAPGGEISGVIAEVGEGVTDWKVGDRVIAPSFSDIFASNAFKNGILAVELPQDWIDRLLEIAREYELTVDIETQTVTTPFQDRFAFEIDPFRKQCLEQGLDEVGLTMARDSSISDYEQRAARHMPWLAKPEQTQTGETPR